VAPQSVAASHPPEFAPRTAMASKKQPIRLFFVWWRWRELDPRPKNVALRIGHKLSSLYAIGQRANEAKPIVDPQLLGAARESNTVLRPEIIHA